MSDHKGLSYRRPATRFAGVILAPERGPFKSSPALNPNRRNAEPIGPDHSGHGTGHRLCLVARHALAE